MELKVQWLLPIVKRLGLGSSQNSPNILYKSKRKEIGDFKITDQFLIALLQWGKHII